MSSCCCSLAGTAACKNCANNPYATGSDGVMAVVSHLRRYVEPQTNGDRIRQMSDEELAEFLCYWDNCSSTEGLGYNTEKVGKYWLCTAPGGGDINGECQTCALSWLKAPVKEGE